IAKGYAADEALQILRANGITRALVSGGGDMAIGDAPPGKKGWRIELANFDEGKNEKEKRGKGEGEKTEVRKFDIMKNGGHTSSPALCAGRTRILRYIFPPSLIGSNERLI